MSIRSFIAVPLSEEVLEAVARTSDGLRAEACRVRGITWVDPDNFHITLKFLGDIEYSDVPEIMDVVNSAVSGIEPFEIAVQGLGGLPRIEKPRVVYAGVSDPEKHLSRIFNGINEGLVSVRKDHKKYIPHITLMRIKHPPAWGKILGLLDGLWTRGFGNDLVRYIDIMESELRPEGPRYRRIERVEL